MQFDETRCGAAGFCAMTVPEGVSLSVTAHDAVDLETGVAEHLDALFELEAAHVGYSLRGSALADAEQDDLALRDLLSGAEVLRHDCVLGRGRVYLIYLREQPARLERVERVYELHSGDAGHGDVQ